MSAQGRPRVVCTRDVLASDYTGALTYDARVYRHLAGQGCAMAQVTEPVGPRGRRLLSSLSFARRIAQACAGPSVLLAYYCQRYELGPALWVCRRRRDVRTVLMVHGLVDYEPDIRWRRQADARYRRRFVGLADEVVVVSEAMRREVAAWHGGRGPRIHVVRPTINPRLADMLPEHGRQAGGRWQGPFTFLNVGRLEPYKGVGVLVEAFLRARCPDAKLVLLGSHDDDRYRREIEARIGSRPGTRDIELTPRVDDPEALASYYRRADCLVLPSLSEGYPMVVLEALAFGLPVIASDIDGVREQISHGRSGMLFPAGDVASLSRCLRRIRSDDALRARLARGAGARSSELQRTWEDVGREFAAVIGEAWDAVHSP